MAKAQSRVPPPVTSAQLTQTLGETLEFLRLLWAVDHGLHSVSKQMVTHLGITAPQRSVIRIIGRFPGILASQLAQLLCLDPGTLSGIIKRLEQRGLITRTIDETDRRRAFLSLTEAGMRYNVWQRGSVEAHIRAGLRGLSPDEIAAARKALEAVAQALNRAATDYPDSGDPGDDTPEPVAPAPDAVTLAPLRPKALRRPRE